MNQRLNKFTQIIVYSQMFSKKLLLEHLGLYSVTSLLA